MRGENIGHISHELKESLLIAELIQIEILCKGIKGVKNKVMEGLDQAIRGYLRKKFLREEGKDEEDDDAGKVLKTKESEVVQY